MNEQELKEIWKSVDAENLPKINFEAVQKNLIGWQNKLRKKIKIDLFITIVLNLIAIPFYISIPYFIYFTPLIAFIWIWYLLQMRRLYKYETKPHDFKNTKEFFNIKTSLMSKYIRQTRIITYPATPIIYILIWIIFGSSEQISEHLIQIIFVIIVLEIFVVAYCEIYFGVMYYPSIREANELLKQLESEE